MYYRNNINKACSRCAFFWLQGNSHFSPLAICRLIRQQKTPRKEKEEKKIYSPRLFLCSGSFNPQGHQKNCSRYQKEKEEVKKDGKEMVDLGERESSRSSSRKVSVWYFRLPTVFFFSKVERKIVKFFLWKEGFSHHLLFSTACFYILVYVYRRKFDFSSDVSSHGKKRERSFQLFFCLKNAFCNRGLGRERQGKKSIQVQLEKREKVASPKVKEREGRRTLTLNFNYKF